MGFRHLKAILPNEPILIKTEIFVISPQGLNNDSPGCSAAKPGDNDEKPNLDPGRVE